MYCSQYINLREFVCTSRSDYWFTDDIAVDNSPRLTGSIDADAEGDQSGIPSDRDESDIDHLDSNSPTTEDVSADEDWELVNAEIRKRHIRPQMPTSAKSTRSSLNVGSLNIAGRDIATHMSRSNHKSKFVKRMVDENRLGILAMQETHLDDCGAADFHKIYQSWFKTIHSAHPTSPNSTAGVAFLLNGKFIDIEHVQEIELIPGHALMINIPWHKGRTVTILNIYAPSTLQERDKMWTQLWTKWKNDTHLPFPNIVLGDWNFVEDTRDRLSVGRVFVPTSFKRLKSLL
ncbi:hypothetical protein B0H17DRAFT_1139122 [Mycena rosella]|uniref:Endonuclease/exonuclease/phosphatase domain-containing protein n=1 Tax=Mycena rosella TaxID=1033263 RepID=A0AAD7D8E0_MYCRO|nr:hypothetical protein B0H17DRAFT_1139122 [Mycena rosella]